MAPSKNREENKERCSGPQGPEERWGRRPDYMPFNRTTCRWTDDEGPLPEVTDDDAIPFVELPPVKL